MLIFAPGCALLMAECLRFRFEEVASVRQRDSRYTSAATDRVYVALAEGKIMVLDRLLVKHVLRCAANFAICVRCDSDKAESVSSTHESSLRYRLLTWLARHVQWLGLNSCFLTHCFSLWTAAVYSAPHCSILEANSSGRRRSSRPSAIAVDPTCSFVAAGDCSGGVRVWDVSQTSGTALLQCPQDSSGRLPASISLISWFKAHARRVSFIAFTSSSDIITVSSGASVRVWSVTGAVIGKVGKAFQSVNLGSGEVVRFRMGKGWNRRLAIEKRRMNDDDVGVDAVTGSSVKVDGTAGRREWRLWDELR